MLTSTHLLALIFILASSTVSAMFVNTKGPQCSLIYFSQITNWANGTFYNQNGDVVIKTRRTGSNISFFENNTIVSSIPASGAYCDNNFTVQDSHGVKFIAHIDYPHKLYNWTFQGLTGTRFIWKLSHSKDEHSKGSFPVTGVVTKEGELKLIARISVANPEKTPNVLHGKAAYRITIINSAGANDVPDRLELMELVYLLYIGPRSCKRGYNIIASSDWPFSGGDPSNQYSGSDCN